jgi:hypothetical protein
MDLISKNCNFPAKSKNCQLAACNSKNHENCIEEILKYFAIDQSYYCTFCKIFIDDKMEFINNHAVHAPQFTTMKSEIKMLHKMRQMKNKKNQDPQSYYALKSFYVCPACEVIEKDWNVFVQVHFPHAGQFYRIKKKDYSHLIPSSQSTFHPLPKMNLVNGKIIERALDSCYRTVRLTNTTLLTDNISDFLQSVEMDVVEMETCLLQEKKQIKICVSLCIDVTDGVRSSFPIHINLKALPLEDLLPELENTLERKWQNFVQKGSNYIISKVNHIDFIVVEYHSIPFHVGHGFVKELSKKLLNKHSVINVENRDNKCFEYAVLSVLHYNDIIRDRHRSSKYEPYLCELNMGGISMPFTVGSLPLFHVKNKDIGINLLRWTDNDEVEVLVPAPLSESRQIVNILLVDDHYVGVANLNRLLNDSNNNSHHSKHYCERCLKPYYGKNSNGRDTLLQAREKHREKCLKNIIQSVRMSENQNFCFNNHLATVSPPYVIYADSEALILPNGEHKPIAFAYHLVPNKNLRNPINATYHEFVGENCVRDFLQSLAMLAQDIVEKNEKNTRELMQITQTEEMEFKLTTKCYLCQKTSSFYVRDHDHYTGKYLGGSCNKCNMLRRIKRRTIPIFFHNGKGYDNHFIMREGFDHFPKWNIDVIPSSMEKYLSMRAHIGDKITLSFLDSCQFLSASLKNLVSSTTTFPHTQNIPVSNTVKFGKGIFPYSHMDNEDKLAAASLPTKENFYNDLNQEECSDDDYEIAKLAWKEFGCKTMKDYLSAYLKLDIYQLTDVFEAFRQVSIEEDELDPVNFMSIPGLSWASAFKMTGESVELLQEEEMHTFFERGIRGGCSFVNKHHIVADDKTSLLYIDANNLYGNALSCPLPQKDFKWEKNHETIMMKIPKMDWRHSSVGYVLEVDLHIPNHLHDKFDDFPLAPETICVKDEWKPEFMKNEPSGSCKKLLMTHHDKKNYIIHFALLQYYISLGIEVTHVHNIISFSQKPFFKKYIDFNSQKRSKAKTKFLKDYYKLKNNSLYGKTMENKRKRMVIRMCRTKKSLKAYTSKPLFIRANRFSDNLVGVQMLNDDIILDKPIYIGQAVLDISKLIMYELRYTTLPRYEEEFGGTIKCVGGDTDSFFLKVDNIHLSSQLLPAMKRDQLLDTSNYPPSHPLFDIKCSARLGCIKDESKIFSLI